ncbi:cytochrome P450 [Streptomyces griseoviridis]|uniref:Cytochrome P450 n=2 Tax=Streptomyces TaxID=1883 RepID=A0A3S9Z6W8_STRGD|nr:MULTISPECIES: cytochrome P450 [Streptomyces]AZS83498.1 cytochrome P450 [Streptomyces griseoviridis]MDH6696295.1 cytochrome P450 [Streptomyces sp. MAA16]MDT0473639.1 cytochrome P450 [Streptomyces sp. DSM 41014]QCN89649.1 cytochrome P450 [Streptomyces griseoviridis]
MTETVATPPSDAPAFPSDRTCPYHLPDRYDDLRAREGSLQRVTLYDGRQVWVVTGHETARKLLADPRLSSDRSDPAFPATSPRVESFRQRRPGFIGLNPPEHGPKRRMTIGEFTVRRIKGMRPDIESIVHGFLDDMIAAGPPADLVSRFALPVPSLVICRLLGVPYEDHDLFQDASRRLVQSTDAAGAGAARDDLESYLGGLVDSLRGTSRPGLLSTLVTEQLETGAIDREELVATAILLLVAGHETTASMTSLSVITLLEHPEQWAALRADPALIPGAVEELLRYLAIADVVGARAVTADIEIDGQHIRAGEGVIIANSITNRDSSAFADPDTFDVHREARHHLSFGYGVHQCLGQNLARLELDIILTALLDRLPGLRLAVPVDRLDLRPGTTIQGVNELPVTW